MEAMIPTRIETGAEARALADKMAAARRRKTRRRIVGLAAFLLLGLSLGTIYAAGFAINTGTTDVPGSSDSPVLELNPGNSQDTSGLNGAISTPQSLQYTWSGRNGFFNQSQVMYAVDLTSEPLANTYYFSVYVVDPMPVGFSDLQLQLRIAPADAAGAANDCEGADIDTASTAGDQRVFIFDASDAQVTFDNLPGQEEYCIGVAGLAAYPDNGKDPQGTFIRRRNSSQFPSQYPSFVATINRTA